MAPRFSLKWLLIAFAILGVALYVAFIRPTALANRFVFLVDHDESQKAESLFIEPRKPFDSGFGELPPPVVRANLLPRTWEDVFAMQRRLEVKVTWSRSPSNDPNAFQFSTRFRATAGFFGLRKLPNHISAD